MPAITLEHVEKVTLSVAHFLRDYLPLANAHNCDLITENLWEKYLHPKVASQISTLDDEKVHHLLSEEVSDMQSALEQIDTKNEHCLKLAQKDGEARPEWNRKLTAIWKHNNLSSFVNEAKKHTLPHLGVLVPIDDIVKESNRKDHCSSEDSGKVKDVQISHGMGDKKCHEVHIMADVCNRFARMNDISQVVDIGSGRGYLGSQLSLKHGLQVLGIDSSSGNTNSASLRTQKLSKLWPHLVRQQEEGSNKKSNREKKMLKKGRRRSLSKAQELNDVPNSDQHSAQNSISRDDIASKESSAALNLEENLSVAAQESLDKENALLKSEDQLTSDISSELYKPITHFVTEETNINELFRTYFDNNSTKSACEIHSYENCSLQKIYPQQNMAETNDRGVASNEISSNSPDSDVPMSSCSETNVLDPASARVLLTGLHTCGDLAASVLQLYAKSSDVHAVCVVGCCYHQIYEKHLRTQFDPTDTAIKPTFPLSGILDSRGCQLGRHARMLACQSIERLSGKVVPRSLHWRALLQVILRDLTGETRDDWRVGRIAAKCSTFQQYVELALKKLNKQHKLTPEDIAQYETKYAHHERQMVAFFQLRAVLAPVIETLIILDRYAYVLEQECTKSAYLVQLFDPVTSPRSYAIIANKRNEGDA